jgi:anti-sigma B factor antagonist
MRDLLGPRGPACPYLTRVPEPAVGTLDERAVGTLARVARAPAVGAGRVATMPTDDDGRAERARKQGSLVLRSERDGDRHVIELLGELDIAGAPRMEEELLRVESTDAASIVVDLRRLEFIDSTGIRLLVMAADRSSANDRFTLLRGPAQVHRVFEITDLASRLPFTDG